jgi:hypothetical protein
VLYPDSERRSADIVDTTVEPVVDIIIDVVVNPPEGRSTIARRQIADSVAIVVRGVTPEEAGTVVGEVGPLARRDTPYIVVVIHTEPAVGVAVVTAVVAIVLGRSYIV